MNTRHWFVRGGALVVLVLAGSSACLPSFEDRPWRVEDTRILAIRSLPAEARPGEAVSYEALVVGPDLLGGEVSTWSFCLQARSADERGAVTRDCALGDALETTSNPANLPQDACARFGPNPPPTQADEPARRPADPDASGGYAIPVRALAEDSDRDGEAVTAFGKTRIRCDLAGATRPIFDEFEDRYTLNLNPAIAGIEAEPTLDAGGNSTLGGEAASVGAGASVELRLRTTSDAVEDYVLYEVELGTLRDVSESLSLRWYFTDGELERAAQTVDTAPSGQTVEFTTVWTAPAESGPVQGWAVLTDDRGGTSWFGFEFVVE